MRGRQPLIVFDAVYDAFRDALLTRTAKVKVGSGPQDDCGPVVTRASLDRLLAAVNAAVARGARVLAGGHAVASLAPGYYMAPTILENVSHDDEISQQELFGPVTCLYRVAGFDEALRLANATSFGLTGAIHTSNSPPHRAVHQPLSRRPGVDQRPDLRRRPAHAVRRRQEFRQRFPRAGHRIARRLLRVEDHRREPRSGPRLTPADAFAPPIHDHDARVDDAPNAAENGKRRICFPITSRAYYGRSQLLLKKLQEHPGIDLELMLGGSILLDKYSRHIADDIEAGGFTISTSLFNVIEGGNHVAMAKTACLTALEFTNGFHAADPDIVVICGDRFEQLAIAMAAAYLNKTIAHIEGGDVTGSIDESVRHAITKLAHIHFVTNDDAHRRVLAMGEDPRYVFTTGSLDVEVAAQIRGDGDQRQREPLRRRPRNRRHPAVPAGDPASGDDRAREPRSISRTRCARSRRSTCR